MMVRILASLLVAVSTFQAGGDPARAERVAARLRAGAVHVNGGDLKYGSPFGGYKQSGNGREYADWAINDFLEVKAILGFGDDSGGR